MINLQQIREFSTMEIHEFLFPIFSPKLKFNQTASILSKFFAELQAENGIKGKKRIKPSKPAQPK